MCFWSKNHSPFIKTVFLCMLYDLKSTVLHVLCICFMYFSVLPNGHGVRPNSNQGISVQKASYLIQTSQPSPANPLWLWHHMFLLAFLWLAFLWLAFCDLLFVTCFLMTCLLWLFVTCFLCLSVTRFLCLFVTCFFVTCFVWLYVTCFLWQMFLWLAFVLLFEQESLANGLCVRKWLHQVIKQIGSIESFHHNIIVFWA